MKRIKAAALLAISLAVFILTSKPARHPNTYDSTRPQREPR